MKVPIPDSLENRIINLERRITALEAKGTPKFTPVCDDPDDDFFTKLDRLSKED